MPQASLFPAAGSAVPVLPATSAGLVGQYYIGDDFDQLAMTRVDPSINFNFGTASPDASIPGPQPVHDPVGRQFTPAKSDNYTFTATADDGVRVYVDGQLVVDDYKLQSVETGRRADRPQRRPGVRHQDPGTSTRPSSGRSS